MPIRILLPLLLFACALPAPARADCSLTTTGVSPLSDSAAGRYRGRPGGLYPGGFSTRPPSHEAAGSGIASAITPLDAAGEPDAAGRIVFISVGMSNTRSAFEGFLAHARADAARDPRVLLVNGAQDSRTAEDWASATSFTWDVLDGRIEDAGGSPAQVQVAWLKLADRYPDDNGAFPDHAELLQARIEQVARSLRVRYPNVRIAWLSSRTRAWTDEPDALNPEPFAFESGFSVRWTIARQLAGDADLNFDPQAGPVVAPFLSWGPYLWIDGLESRSDGLQWLCNDVGGDFIHPSNNGVEKVGGQLQAFFKTDPLASVWYLRPGTTGSPPTCAATASPVAGLAPLTVAFRANASESDGALVERAWSFADGTGSLASDPTKTFLAADEYTVRLTVSDDDGNSARCAVRVRVPEPGSSAAGVAAVLALSLLVLPRIGPSRAATKGRPSLGSRGAGTRTS